VDTSTIISVLGVSGTTVFGILSIYMYRKTLRINEEKRRITWSDLMIVSKELRREIEEQFHPDIIFAPCRRGVTIANLMFDVGENIILYMGIREDLREKTGFEHLPEDYDKIQTTGIHNHYLPRTLSAQSNKNILIIDDFASTGDSLRTIVDYMVEKGFQKDKIKTATIVCSESAILSGKAPDFFSLKMPPDFYFPWGRAR